jgi:hypothetical protein
MLSWDDLEILELVLECCQLHQVEPLSSLEAEAFFNPLVADYPEPTNREGLRAWLKEQIPQHFRVDKERPRWIQGAAGAFAEGQPMIFAGQLDLEGPDRPRYHDDTSLYVFIAPRQEPVVVLQQY